MCFEFLMSSGRLAYGCKILSVFCVLLCVVTIPRLAHASEPGYLSLQSVLLFSLYESTKVKISNEKEEQALYSIDEARAAYYPDIKFLMEAGREYNNPAAFDNQITPAEQSNVNNSVDANITLRQMLFDRTKTSEVLRRQQLATSKNIEGVLVEQDVIKNTVDVYVDIVELQKRVQASAEMLEMIKALVDRVKVAFEAGGESKATYDYASARLSLAKSKYEVALSTYRDSISRIEALTGKLPDFLAIEPEELSVQEYDLSFYKHLASKKNSELRLIDSNIQATKIDYEKQQASYLPKVNIVVEAAQSYDKGGNVGTDKDASAMIQLQYDIFKGFGRRATKGKIASKLRELEYEKEDLIKDITKKVNINYNEITALKETILTKAMEVKSYLSLREIAKKSFEEGEIDLFQSIENEEKLYEAQDQIHKFQSDVYKKSYDLLKLIGSLKADKFCESC